MQAHAMSFLNNEKGDSGPTIGKANLTGPEISDMSRT